MQGDKSHNGPKIGYLHEARFRLRAQELGYVIFTTDYPYIKMDCAIYKDNIFSRIQIKTATLEDGILHIRTSTKRRNETTGKRSLDIAYTKEDIDFFGIHCPELNKNYLIPIEHCAGRVRTRLLFEKQDDIPCIGCLFAKDYEF